MSQISAENVAFSHFIKTTAAQPLVNETKMLQQQYVYITRFDLESFVSFFIFALCFYFGSKLAFAII